ncbi:MAG TPA: formylglycine-generating enzyme family protein [Gallionellaceae bacterium]
MSSALKASPAPQTGRARRKRYLTATIVTCVVLLTVGGVLHVIKIGATRIEDMRRLASYDPKDMDRHIRAAGEDITLHHEHEFGAKHSAGYTVEEAEALLPKEKWAELDSVITIPAGPFAMGTNLERTDVQDHPQHTVTLPAYKIDKYPVTNAQYARFVAATGHRPPSSWKAGRIPEGELLKPVTLVDWFDAKKYAEWAGKRLPTEAEFEKAGRGTDARRWPWGNRMEPDRLNTYYNVGSATDVMAYVNGASPYGVMGLSGNVDEWVADDFAPYPGSDAPADLFKGKVARAESAQDRSLKVVELKPVNQQYKVLRGGSWKSDPFSTALYHRNFAFPYYASDFFGFRCAADIQGKEK